MNTQNHPALISALLDPTAYDHPCRDIQLIETHISWLLLTGDYAYKIKKPVNFGFLDFSTLPLRQHFCTEEIRLNARLAPQIYLRVVRISGSATEPHINGDGPVVRLARAGRKEGSNSVVAHFMPIMIDVYPLPFN